MLCGSDTQVSSKTRENNVKTLTILSKRNSNDFGRVWDHSAASNSWPAGTIHYYFGSEWYWNTWAKNHEVEELREGIWFELVKAVFRRKHKRIWVKAA